MNRLLLILFVLIFSPQLFAQQRVSEWYFGVNSGLRFENGDVSVSHSGSLNTPEGSATMCDENGRLLFYTDGQTVYTGDHREMVNGTGLMGHSSSTQSALIIPKPGSAALYYIFTTDQLGSSNGLRYSIVDMSLSNGEGAVTAVKNVQLLNACAEKLTATRSDGCSGFWVIAHGVNNNRFFSFKLTESGIAANPVISNAGSVHGVNGETRGFMKVSPDGRYLAVAVSSPGRFMEILEFNASSGIVSTQNIRKVMYSQESPYGIEFSADISKIYISATNSIYQYDLNALQDQFAFMSSQYQILSPEPVYGLQLGPNGKIYVAKNSPYLDVINSPEKSNVGCGYGINSIYLGLNRQSTFGLPSFIQDYLIERKIIVEKTCLGDSTSFLYVKEKAVSLSWNFDDFRSPNNFGNGVNPKHLFSGKGTYNVKLRVETCEGSQIFSKQVIVEDRPQFTLGNDTTICAGKSLYLTPGIPMSNYLWQDGTTLGALTVNQAGMYSVQVEKNGCVASDTMQVLLSEPKVDILADYISSCINSNDVRLSFKGQGNESDIRWCLSDGTKSDLPLFNHHFTQLGSNKIKLTIVNIYGCKTSDSTNIFINPVVEAGFAVNDPEQCLSDNLFEVSKNITSGAGVLKQYSFSNGQQTLTDQPFKHSFTAPGSYVVLMQTETDKGCKDTASLTLVVLPDPVADFTLASAGNCDNNNQVNIRSISSSSNGSISRILFDLGNQTVFNGESLIYSYSSAGSYEVKLQVTDAKGCVSSRSKNIQIHPAPVTSFVVDGSGKCAGKENIEFKNLTTISSGTIKSYFWDFGDGQTSNLEKPSKTYTNKGIYQAKLTTESDKGCTSVFQDAVFAFEKPKADFVLENLEACFSNNKVNLVDKSTYTDGAASLIYSWNIDGNTLFQKNVMGYSFNKTGSRNIELMVTTPDGCEDRISKSIEIFPSPRASFSINDPVQCENANTFSALNTSSGNINDMNLWSLNGESYLTQDLTVSLNKAGRYELVLTVTDDHKCQSVAKTILEVIPTPLADFKTEDVCLTERMVFYNTSLVTTGSIVKTVWDFGDNESSYEVSPSHTYKDAGKFLVYMEVTSNEGCRSTIVKEVMVNAMPVSSFETKKQGFENGKTIYEFKELSEVAENTYKWHINHVEIGSGPYMVKKFEDTGTYQVELMVITDKGCTQTSEQFVFVVPPFNLYLPNAFTPNGDGKNDVFGPTDLQYMQNYEMVIYNRWGTIMFQSNDLNQPWDGTYFGKEAPLGVYLYQITTVDLEGKERVFSGPVLLMK